MARWRPALLAAGLVVATIAAFSPALRYGFVDYDDHVYVTDNPRVAAGLTPGNVRWAFTTFHFANYHPLTWLSYLLDAQLYGLDARGYHAHNLVLHAATAALLFEALRRTTGDVWPSLAAAALFALHPLRVESVAWVSERKDVLSGLFGVATILAYAGYARRPSAGRYALVMVLYACGLMSKPVLVTLPAALVLLDYWPLKRPVRWGLLLEKGPLAVMSAGLSVAAFAAQRSSDTVAEIETLPVRLRVANAAIAYVRYLGKTLWPRDLVYLYPLSWDIPTVRVIGAIALLIAITVVAVFAHRRAPYLLVGWLWFVGSLVPMIGIVQVGQQAMADRYTYWPSIGLSIAAAWGAAGLVRRSGVPPAAVAGGGGALLVALALLTARQTTVWRDGPSLFGHAIAINPANASAHRALGNSYKRAGHLDGAAASYARALELDPRSEPAHTNLAIVLARLGRTAEAIAHYRSALEIAPRTTVPRTNLTNLHNARGAAAATAGDLAFAEAEFRAALDVDPASAEAHNNLGQVHLLRGRIDEAVEAFERALQLKPDLASARSNLARARGGSPASIPSLPSP